MNLGNEFTHCGDSAGRSGGRLRPGLSYASAVCRYVARIVA